MSVYETYDETSRHFDSTRVPIGSEIILGCLARHEKSLDARGLDDRAAAKRPAQPKPAGAPAKPERPRPARRHRIAG